MIRNQITPPTISDSDQFRFVESVHEECGDERCLYGGNGDSSDKAEFAKVDQCEQRREQGQREQRKKGEGIGSYRYG